MVTEITWKSYMHLNQRWGLSTLPRPNNVCLVWALMYYLLCELSHYILSMIKVLFLKSRTLLICHLCLYIFFFRVPGQKIKGKADDYSNLGQCLHALINAWGCYICWLMYISHMLIKSNLKYTWFILWLHWQFSWQSWNGNGFSLAPWEWFLYVSGVIALMFLDGFPFRY